MYYFYATLESDELLHVVGYQHFHDGRRPLGIDAAIQLEHETYTAGKITVIEGELARLLYTAVSGRWRHEEPSEASAEKATYARRVLAAYARMEVEVGAVPPAVFHRVHHAAQKAHEAIIKFGHQFQPGYGTYNLRKGGEEREYEGFFSRDLVPDGTMFPIPVELWPLYMSQ